VAVEEVGPAIFRITIPIPFDLRDVNVYLVDTGEGFLLVDAGVSSDEARAALEASVADLGIAFHDIRTILVTHFHADHAGLARWVRERAGAPIVMSGRDAAALDQFFASGFPAESPAFFEAHGAPRAFDAIARAMSPALSRLMLPFTADRIVETGDAVVTSRRAVGLLTPGHTPGHLAVWLPEESTLFAGDHVLPHITPNIGLYGFGDPNPLGSYLVSLERVRRAAPRRIFPAHGAVLDEPQARIDEIVQHHRRRLDHVVSATGRAGSSAWSVAAHLFGDDLDAMQAWLAFFESLAHLEYLVHEGVLRRDEDRARFVYVPS
jgi:glyoxylase-like metal-dependent hydrolase (beta-lactamase superfamily II)